MNCGHLGRAEYGQPHPAPEVTVPQRFLGRAGEDKAAPLASVSARPPAQGRTCQRPVTGSAERIILDAGKYLDRFTEGPGGGAA